MSQYVYVSMFYNSKRLLLKDDKEDPIKFTSEKTVKYIKQEIIDKIDPEATQEGLSLIYDGKTITKGKTLIDFIAKQHFKKRRTIDMTAITISIGGSIDDSKDDIKYDINNYKKKFIIGMNKNKKRVPDLNDINCSFSKNECCILFVKNIYNTKMTCGHTINPIALFCHMTSVFTKNCKDYIIKCPVIKCNKVWDFDDIAEICSLDNDEYTAFSSEIAKRSKPETKICPNCKTETMRPKDLKIYRVNCTRCRKKDWCFNCAGFWKNTGFTVCGNEHCYTWQIKLIIETCATKSLGKEWNDVIVPIYRACPSCYNIIQHKEKCKHMTCNKCKHEFCFSCLKKWPCPVKYNYCEAAARQKI